MADYAIIGFGCAGYYGAKAIRENDFDTLCRLLDEGRKIKEEVDGK